jgi:hypothetical protein
VAICIVKGPDYIVELANEDMLEFMVERQLLLVKLFWKSCLKQGNRV